MQENLDHVNNRPMRFVTRMSRFFERAGMVS